MKLELDEIYERLVDEEDARVCKDIPEQSCHVVPRNFFVLLAGLGFTKLADSFANTKTVLPVLMSSVGAPAGLSAMLVPIRESGSMLPQLFLGGLVRQYAIRKYFYVLGNVLQALAIALMLVVSYTLEGAVAGYSIIALLVCFSLSRGLCSVASKDVMGKTVPKTRRGRLTGLSASIAGFVSIVFALLVAQGFWQEGNHLGLFLGIAAALWLAAACISSQIDEQPGATDGGGNALKAAFDNLSVLKSDSEFRYFVLVRALLMSSGLAAPFLVGLGMADMSSSAMLSQLPWYVGLSGLASLLSGFVWGKASDTDSRKVLCYTGAGVASICFVAALISAADADYFGDSLKVLSMALFFFLMLIHEGVRLGRKTYLIDMAGGNKRTAYVSVSNTLIGALLLLVGLITAGISAVSTPAVFLFFAVSSALAVVIALAKLRAL